MKINSNMQAQIANSVLKSNESKYSGSTEKLSSGYKINHAKDAPAGMAISNKMYAQLKSLDRASQNASNGINVLQTAEGALSEMQAMVQRINELAIKAANGTVTDTDREAIQQEIDQLTSEIDRISEDTEYNTQHLLDGEQGLKGYTDNSVYEVDFYEDEFPLDDYVLQIDSVTDIYDSKGNVKAHEVTAASLTHEEGGVQVPFDGTVRCEKGKIIATTKSGSEMIIGYEDLGAKAVGDTVNLQIKGIGGMKFQVGSMEGQEIQVTIPRISKSTLSLHRVDVRSEEFAKQSIELAKSAIEKISAARSTIGAYQNRLEATSSSLDVTTENLTKSYSTIKDIDMADEMVEYTKLQILVQAGTTMLTQANEQPQQALQLLQ